MSFPFGGHPTLGRFVEAAKEQGCTADVIVRTSPSRRAYQVLKIQSPDGGHVIVVNPDFGEYLVPSIVSNYQRRLGIETSFASEPE